jgi:hypothetical protein
MQYAENEISEFLASIAEMDIATFNEQPFDFPLSVIEHLSETENLPLFFERARGLLGKIGKQS